MPFNRLANNQRPSQKIQIIRYFQTATKRKIDQVKRLIISLSYPGKAEMNIKQNWKLHPEHNSHFFLFTECNSSINLHKTLNTKSLFSMFFYDQFKVFFYFILNITVHEPSNSNGNCIILYIATFKKCCFNCLFPLHA
jgi:hypothetical protein